MSSILLKFHCFKAPLSLQKAKCCEKNQVVEVSSFKFASVAFFFPLKTHVKILMQNMTRKRVVVVLLPLQEKTLSYCGLRAARMWRFQGIEEEVARGVPSEGAAERFSVKVKFSHAQVTSVSLEVSIRK